MSTLPKQDERTPGRFWVENRDGRWQVQMEHRGPGSSFCVAQINHWADDGRALAEQIVNSLNAYTSTDALRSALAGLVAVLQIDEPWAREHVSKFNDAMIKARAALSGSPAPSTSPMEIEMTEAQIKHMVDRFLAWKLPKTFSPDGGISFERIAGADGPHPFTNEPSGTNLLCATEATEMVRHMLEGLPGGSPAPSTEGLRDLEPGELLPCPFCGGKAEVYEFDDVGEDDENFGGSAIVCTNCQCTTAVHFDRKEHLYSSWNEREPDAARTALAGVTAPQAGSTD